MNVTGLSLCPPSTAEDNPKVTPELLAASLARYSRSNEGIDKILKSIDWANPDKAVDSIFRFVDYGHASIGGLTGGIAMAIDGISMFLAYKVFEFSQQADGQESSTRYIKMTAANLPPPESVGIPEKYAVEWTSLMTAFLEVYQIIYSELDDLAKKDPAIVRAPSNTPPKVLDRLRRNYALDRARYVIPLALKTNMGIVMSARSWVEVIRQIESLGLIEATRLAGLLRVEIAKYAPRLIRHSSPDQASSGQAEQLWRYSKSLVVQNGVSIENLQDKVFVSIENLLPSFFSNGQTITEGMAGKVNRYSTAGSSIKRILVRFAWNNIAFAELRDLNRHRTGYRFSPLAPVGFYLPEGIGHRSLESLLQRYKRLVVDLASDQDTPLGTHVYAYLLGTQVGFEHSTHADKLIYEIELRTGIGAHFRYAEHLKAVAAELLKAIPELGPHIQIGTAEPE